MDMKKIQSIKARLMKGGTTLSFVILAALTLTFTSCNKARDLATPQSTGATDKNMMEVLETYAADGSIAGAAKKDRKPTFSTLKVALARTGLTSTVATQPLTVFAPTDEAFAALGLYPNNIASVPNLKEILLYHVVGGVVLSNQLSNGFVPTLNGAAVQIDLTNGVKVNNANVILADVLAKNGVIHVVDKVLLPPTKNLVELAQSLAPEFSILLAAAQKADLAGVLATDGPFTVFAPTNDAFVALLAEKGFTSLDDVPVDDLKAILLYHVVSGRVYSSDLSSGPVNTLGGTFNLDLTTLKITDAKSRQANLVPSLLNVQATNGVVHVIDRVILP